MKKAYIIDTNLPAIYCQDVSSKHIERFFHRLASDSLIILSSNGWYDQASQICSLLNINNIDIVSGGGSCFKINNQENFIYDGFLNNDTLDLILHLAISSQSGVLVKGQLKNKPGTNVLLNYFLNVQSAKQFKLIWKFDFTINNDYLSFENQLKQIDVSEIYVYSSGSNFDEKFFDENNELNDLLLASDINVNQFFNNTYLFNLKSSSKFKVISKYLTNLDIPLNNVTYVSLKEFDNEGKEFYGQIVVPANFDTSISNANYLTYDTKRLDKILE
ncbi:MPN552 family protein [Mycoplasmoides pirum]|uniref:MPN552 family protein n=1 Tax=Mycoplasmoides pirum TaxID=2122 RepID=UPI000483D2C5|nr:hypothetical protein [Mycoplasmoides pirum]